MDDWFGLHVNAFALWWLDLSFLVRYEMETNRRRRGVTPLHWFETPDVVCDEAMRCLTAQEVGRYRQTGLRVSPWPHGFVCTFVNAWEVNENATGQCHFRGEMSNGIAFGSRPDSFTAEPSGFGFLGINLLGSGKSVERVKWTGKLIITISGPCLSGVSSWKQVGGGW